MAFYGMPSHIKVFLKNLIKTLIWGKQPEILNSHIHDIQGFYNVFSWEVFTDFILPFALFDKVG